MTPVERFTISNNTLSEVVSSFRITKSEYALLTSLLYAHNGANSVSGEVWLAPSLMKFHVDSNELQIKMLRLPLSDMPLYINSTEFEKCLIALWRLKIGR